MSYRNQPVPLNLYPSNHGQHRSQSVQSSSSSALHPSDHQQIRHTSASQKSDNSPLPHFLEKEIRLPKYPGPETGARMVKMKPMDKDVFFDGTNVAIEKFIKRYECAGEADGASARDLAKQVIFFIKDADLKDEIEEMTGYEDFDWEGLKKQLLDRFGKALPLVKYTKQDLESLVSSAVSKGGIRTLSEFQVFKTRFEAVTHYLVRMGYNTSIEEFRELLLEALSRRLGSAVIKELIRDNQMIRSRDGGDILPPTVTLIAYIQREVQSDSVMKRQNLWSPEKNQENLPESQTKPAPRIITPSTPVQNSYDKQLQDLTKQLAALTSGNMAPPHKPLDSVSQQANPPTSAPSRNTNFRCYYCFQPNHSSNRCNLFSFDESNGLVKKEGRSYLLPNDTPIAWDTSRPIKEVVDQFSENSKKTAMTEIDFYSSFGQLEEIYVPSLSSYEEDGDLETEELDNSSVAFTFNPPSEPENIFTQQTNKFLGEITEETEPQDLHSEDQPASKTSFDEILTTDFTGLEEKITQRMLEDFNVALNYEDKNFDGLEDFSQKEEYNTSTFIEDINSTFSPINTVARNSFHMEDSDISVSSFSAQLMGTSAKLEEESVIFQPEKPFGNDISAENRSSFYVSLFENDNLESDIKQKQGDYPARFNPYNLDKVKEDLEDFSPSELQEPDFLLCVLPSIDESSVEPNIYKMIESETELSDHSIETNHYTVDRVFVQNRRDYTDPEENRQQGRDSRDHENEEHRLDILGETRKPLEDDTFDVALNVILGLLILILLKLLKTWDNGFLLEAISLEAIVFKVLSAIISVDSFQSSSERSLDHSQSKKIHWKDNQMLLKRTIVKIKEIAVRIWTHQRKNLKIFRFLIPDSSSDLCNFSPSTLQKLSFKIIYDYMWTPLNRLFWREKPIALLDGPIPALTSLKAADNLLLFSILLLVNFFFLEHVAGYAVGSVALVANSFSSLPLHILDRHQIPSVSVSFSDLESTSNTPTPIPIAVQKPLVAEAQSSKNSL
ncbi:hypothetical protein PGTUg99_019152 [Puccinia graminis f. sp. tritici]|uniref:Uncharacterized protein n=1 Tax=Puccinia graminis f. sp. tritici TaxID=56615 RepID=A0A5B0PI38_PUCGR|nr:hypothetical protein PGTUg99_019152 [Puccinia graminis f. sp. tritici]